MNNNDLLRRLRYALRCDDAETARLITEGGSVANAAMCSAWRIKEGEPGYMACSVDHMSAFLKGLILDRRGPQQNAPSANTSANSSANKSANPWEKAKAAKAQRSGGSKAQAPASAAPAPDVKVQTKSGSADAKAVEPEMDNNEVLKQLRIALKLRSGDLHQILKLGGSSLSESEANALFRSESARNFRRCGDQVLRQFVAGLAKQRNAEGDQDEYSEDAE